MDSISRILSPYKCINCEKSLIGLHVGVLQGRKISLSGDTRTNMKDKTGLRAAIYRELSFPD